MRGGWERSAGWVGGRGDYPSRAGCVGCGPRFWGRCSASLAFVEGVVLGCCGMRSARGARRSVSRWVVGRAEEQIGDLGQRGVLASVTLPIAWLQAQPGDNRERGAITVVNGLSRGGTY